VQEHGGGGPRRGPDREPDREPDDQAAASGAVARYLRVRGRVQGVFFRSATRQTAGRYGVTGWVRNHPDGSVEAWLEGDARAVEEVQAWVLAGGPPSAEVTDADVRAAEPEGHDRFEVRP
jgi:acylphosphatase